MAIIEKLTAIATAIRNKTGKTATLTLDEMATEIAALAAVDKNKILIDYGEYIPTSTTYGYLYLEHGLGVVPTFSVAVADAAPSDDSFRISVWYKVGSYAHGEQDCSTTTLTWNYAGSVTDETKFMLKQASENYGQLKAGYKYTWVVVKVVA